MRVAYIDRSGSNPQPLHDKICHYGLKRDIPLKDWVFAIRYGPRSTITRQDREMILALQGSTIITNNREPRNHPSGRKPSRVPYVEVIRSEKDRFSLVGITSKPVSGEYPREHEFAFFTSGDGSREFFVLLPEGVFLSNKNAARIIASRYPQPNSDSEYFGFRLIGSGSQLLFHNGKISESNNFYKHKMGWKAVGAVKNLIEPVLPALAEFSRIVGAEWIAEKIKGLPPC